VTIPVAGRRARLIVMGYGAALFLWMSVEDNAVWPVTLYGVGLAALIVNLTLSDKIGGKFILPRWLPLAGALWGGLNGLSANLAVTGLMFFKNAIHAHFFLDYPPALMLAMMGRAPGWTAAGSLIGIGLALAWLSKLTRKHERTAKTVAEETA
jgi:hypothetical protein